jgi:hypothetical protein
MTIQIIAFENELFKILLLPAALAHPTDFTPQGALHAIAL